MAVVNLIHKSDVYFELSKPIIHKPPPIYNVMDNMHNGELYIYNNQLFLNDGKCWYKAEIKDIKEIETVPSQRQIHIHFVNFDLVLFCDDYVHLMALRDFIYISQNNTFIDNFKVDGKERLGGGNYF